MNKAISSFKNYSEADKEADRKFLAAFAREEKEFQIRLNKSFNQRFPGSHFSVRQTKGLYTISCQLFHRLWWSSSLKNTQRYAKAQGGKTLYQYLLFNKRFQMHPQPVQELQTELKNFAITEIHRYIEEKELIKEEKDQLVERVATELLPRYFQGGLTKANQAILESKKEKIAQHKNFKNKMKKDSIFRLLLPLVWDNIIYNFKKNPEAFYRF